MNAILILEKDDEWRKVLSDALATDYDLAFRDHTEAIESIQYA